MNISQLRKEIKPLGFGAITKSFSWGKNIIYKHIETGELLTFNVFDDEHMERWNPLLFFLQENKVRIAGEWEGEKLIGLIPDVSLKLSVK